MTETIILEKIKKLGGRITKVRLALIRILIKSGCVVSESALIDGLGRQKLKPNRSTIYRELIFLTDHNIIKKSVLVDQDYYELVGGHHHHHLICLKCNLIVGVELDNHLDDQEKKMARKHKFKNIYHSLEFYGYCQKCQVKK